MRGGRLCETLDRGKRGRALFGALGGWAAIAGRIVLYNWCVAGGFVAGANLVRVGHFPLGYIPVLAHWGLYGLFLGSDSFAHTQDGRLLPSVAVLVGRSGFVEMTGYTLLAAATTGLFLYRQASWRDMRTVRERHFSDWRLSMGEWLALTLSFLSILAAGVKEALVIWGRTGQLLADLLIFG